MTLVYNKVMYLRMRASVFIFACKRVGEYCMFSMCFRLEWTEGLQATSRDVLYRGKAELFKSENVVAILFHRLHSIRPEIRHN